METDLSSFKYDVFLSYSSDDKKIVHTLADRLRNDGLHVWLDLWSIEPGDSIPLMIQHGLEQSRIFLMCMSPAYFSSEWGRLEHLTLLFRDPTNSQRRFIPLLIEDCSLPNIISQFAYIDWRFPSDEAYAKILIACRKIDTEKTNVIVQTKREILPLMVLKGHLQNVYALAISHDGKTIVSGSLDKTLKIWDLATGRYKATFFGHEEIITAVAITPDGATVVSGSLDNTLKVWDIKTGHCKATLKGHTSFISCIAITPNGKIVVSSSNDHTLKVWNLEIYRRKATFVGHTSTTSGIAITPDGKTLISGSFDNTLKVWDLATGQCKSTFKGHPAPVQGVAITPDGKNVVSSSNDTTLKVWDLASGQCRATFEGHTDHVCGVAITPDGKNVVSSSNDTTLKVWDLASGQCRATFKGHTGPVRGVVITPDGHTVVSSSWDTTLKVWRLPQSDDTLMKNGSAARYTNAKVVIVGKTSVGKTGLALRLCENRWVPTESTHGMIVSRLQIPSFAESTDIEREVWLWDFAGQPDYRLIHQLYMDETALGVLVFDPQDDNPFEEIGFWEKALRAATKCEISILLVAGRCDRGGITISKSRFNKYVDEHGFSDFLCTEAKTGDGCEELKTAISRYIPWNSLPWIASSQLFKTLKDAILKFTEERSPLVRLPELRQRLQIMMPNEAINEAELRAVVGLMQGQGVVQMLNFGDFILLQPEWINRYASIVVRMAREHTDEMGVVSEHQVLDGHLNYKDMNRLAEVDERILLRAMVQTFLNRSLCIRQDTPHGTMLVFPSYFRRDKPDLPEHPHVLVTYGFSGPLEEIYSTLVVRLVYSDGFKIDQLWKDAADFKSPGGKRVGLAMVKKNEGTAEIIVYFETGVPDDTKVMFIKYIHEHLLARAQPRESVTRVRIYICPHCDIPLENQKAIQIRLKRHQKDIICPVCEKRVPLIDLIEEKFDSDIVRQQVRELDERARINLDNESRELILVGHAIAIAAEAGQIYRPITWADWGIDGEIEFKNNKSEASGQRVYLQLKSGDSYLYHRDRDDVDIFTIKKKRQVKYWLAQAYPVMLVIRTSEGKIRWMNITEYLQQNGPDTEKIVFKGEPFTALNVAKLRDTVLREYDES